MSLVPRIHADTTPHIDVSRELWPTSTVATQQNKTRVPTATVDHIARTSSNRLDMPEVNQARNAAPGSAKLSFLEEQLEKIRMTPEQEAAYYKAHPPMSASEREAAKTGFDFSSQLFQLLAGGFLFGTTRKVVSSLGKVLTQGASQTNAPLLALARADITPANAAQSYKLLNSEYRKQLAGLTSKADRAELKQQRNTAVASIKDQLLLSGHDMRRGQVKPFASHTDAVERWIRAGVNEDQIASRYVSGATPKNIDELIHAATTTQNNMAKHVQTLYKSDMPNKEAQRDAAVTVWNGTDKALAQLKNLRAEWGKKAGSETKALPHENPNQIEAGKRMEWDEVRNEWMTFLREGSSQTSAKTPDKQRMVEVVAERYTNGVNRSNLDDRLNEVEKMIKDARSNYANPNPQHRDETEILLEGAHKAHEILIQLKVKSGFPKP